MTVLHICNGFLVSNLYKELYGDLFLKGIDQTVYVPFRSQGLVKREDITDSNLEYSLTFSPVLKKYHRIFFRKKISYLHNDIEENVDLKGFSLIHCTTLFSDGAIALKIWKSHSIPFMVTVRVTDIHVFFKYRKDLIPLALEILGRAERIVFISHSLQEKFFELPSIRKYEQQFLCKSTVIPNGISEYWHKNIIPQKQEKPRKFIYVGTFIKRKNVVSLIKAFLALRSEYPTVELTLVGGTGAQESEVFNLVKENSECINYLGLIKEKEELRKVLEDHDIFVMPSYYETFGLVYIEALSQGLPILFSKGDGVDKFFNIEIGERVNPLDNEDIKLGLERILTNYDSYELDRIDFNQFNWDEIGRNYTEIYSEIAEENSAKKR